MTLVASEGAFTWLSLLPFLQGEGAKFGPLAHSLIISGVILLLAVVARGAILRQLAAEGADARTALVPESNLTIRNGFDLYAESLLNFMRDVLGHDAPRYFPLIATVFLYVFASNVVGLIPGVLPPTDSLNTNFPIAICIFLVYNAAGMKAHGVGGYLAHFAGPVMWLAPLLFVIEIFSHCVRPVTLSVRLWANIFADHIILDTFLNTLPTQIHPVLGFGVPVVFMGLGLFVSFIQAFVFSLLSMVYIALAVAHDH